MDDFKKWQKLGFAKLSNRQKTSFLLYAPKMVNEMSGRNKILQLIFKRNVGVYL